MFKNWSFLIYFYLLVVLFHPKNSFSLPDGLHPTPPMGWSSWNTFFGPGSEEQLIEQANALKSLGLDELGYVFITIDDNWSLPERNNVTGRIQTNMELYPRGIQFLSGYLHDKGLKIGMYSSAGRYTCSCYLPGSLGYEKIDVEMLLEYEIDYFKYDNCYPRMDGSTQCFGVNPIEAVSTALTQNTPEPETNLHDCDDGCGAYVDLVASLRHFPSIWQSPSEESRYEPMAKALADVKSIRNITFEICAWGFGNVERFGPRFGHMWRTSPDISDDWESMMWNLDINDEVRYRQPGAQGPEFGWNYPDALFVGKGGMTTDEYRSMFALWCLVKSPLMLGTDLTLMTKESEAYKIITNERLLAINQDSLGIQGSCVKDCCSHGPQGGITSRWTCYHFAHSWQVWQGPLSNGCYAVVVLNRFNEEKSITMDWAEDAKIPITNNTSNNLFDLQNLWTGEILGQITVGKDAWKGTLAAHQNQAFKLTPIIS